MKTIFVLIILLSAITISTFLCSSHVPRKTVALYTDTLEAERKMYIERVLSFIGSKENTRADSVFKNLKVMRGVSAKMLVSTVMYFWSQSLGVSCTHCHNTTNWASDEKPEKDIARSMVAMQSRIHREILDSLVMAYKISRPHLSCLSCHHGQAIPEY